ncbi:MAG: hypothetical protein AAGC77_13095, partial [Pseudomonadota bacterium]
VSGSSVRPMIIVSPLEHAEKAMREYKPSHIISVLDHDIALPSAIDETPEENRLKLFGDCSASEAGKHESRCEKAVKFAKHWAAQDKPRAPLLIHCELGVARSMAIAYIMMCAIDNDRSETEIAERLRRAAPHADPNLLLVSEADALLERNDRMVEAILDMEPCCGAVDTPIVTLPIAA